MEAAAWFRVDPRLLQPVASLMQHGPHLPLRTDEIITTAVAEGIAARCGVLVAPTIPYGAGSDADRAYAGASIVGHKTLHRTLNDLVGGWESQGLEEIVLLTSNGYGPHYRALVSTIGEAVRIRAVDINVVDLSSVLERAGPERAGEIETSLVLHLAPGQVRTDLIADPPENPLTGMVRMDGSEPLPLPGTNGVIGSPKASSAEKGKRIYEYLVRYIGDRLFGEKPSDD